MIEILKSFLGIAQPAVFASTAPNVQLVQLSGISNPTRNII